ncbi:phosphoribosyltransferase [Sinorhizobium fredii USDA 205]|uniref:Phosphoribosyltransferase n=2 Tax=Rhizobium fredii TaxID=380 RepID=A0A844AK64_RHIFR|nr:phosphoribosyltransferase family protein [Sinorhizobium fredii]KSV84475.1 phosphoribosyltransferase [Sinorhizobium fredii USDA 205]ASY71562.1 Biotin carboxylase [Sinorhizobium fredii CCBAU 83666]MQX12065.1 phosphoribosyltransferase [Sinorhizobium fredii]GEC33238.1 phosphoribosyltransferase [Sinorhizobium fredii]GLS08322.1 phosphoribosyltransferase [Sinorhizobium fredii]
MHYRSIVDMSATIVRNLHRLPGDIDLVVGIPRSGMLAANLFSLTANIQMTDLDSFVAGKVFSSGITKRSAALGRTMAEMRRILILDDSINGGSAMREARVRAAAAGVARDQLIFAAVYGTYERYEEADLVFEVVPQPRLFQWNVMHHKFLGQSCVDIDGVLCFDPTREENDDGPTYLNFLAQARPLYVPTRKIAYLVTSRLEKYRPQTAAWLAAQGIEYGELVMLDLPSKEERQRLAAHGRFKAEFYKRSDAVLFIESEHDQAMNIAKLSGKPVLCVESQQMISPDMLWLSGQLMQATTSEGRKAMLKAMARTVLGETGYQALKSKMRKPA